MFGTHRHLDPGEIRYGLDRYYPNEEDENFFMLLKKPFGRMDTSSRLSPKTNVPPKKPA
jgi:hypothetical protein